jgi:hypothetical protein
VYLLRSQLTGAVSGQVSGTATPLKKHSGGVPVPGSYDAIMQAVEEKVQFLTHVSELEVLRVVLCVWQRSSKSAGLNYDIVLVFSSTSVYSAILVVAPSVCFLKQRSLVLHALLTSLYMLFAGA